MGQFISQDPIGFAAGDANVRRYVGNDPTQNVDPTGLLGQVIIWINPANMPADFNLKAVEAKMQEALSTAGSKVKVHLRLTTISKEKLQLGWNFDSISWVANNPPWGLLYTCGHDVYTFYTRRVVTYEHYAEFSTASGLGAMSANFTDEHSKYYIYNIAGQARKLRSDGKEVIPDILYANLMLHEVFWFGVIDAAYDGVWSPVGSLKSGTASANTLMDMKTYAEVIDDQLHNKNSMLPKMCWPF